MEEVIRDEPILFIQKSKVRKYIRDHNHQITADAVKAIDRKVEYFLRKLCNEVKKSRIVEFEVNYFKM